MTTKTGISLASLDVRKTTDTPVRIEYFGPDLQPSGIFLLVIGAQSETASAKINALLNEKRRQAAVTIATAKPSRGAALGLDLAYTPVEDDIDLAQKMSAAYLVGWDGIAEDYTPERGLQLIRSNPHLKAQVDAIAQDIAAFTKASPKRS